MDIHRCRFVPYQPSAINAVAFSHSSHSKQPASPDLRLAVGRENGDIEIWNPLRGNWTQERIFRGGAGRTIEQVRWTQDLILPDEDEELQKPAHGHLRLFSSGGSGSITEWDLERGTPKRHADGNAGDIWCFASQPQWTSGQARNGPTDVRSAPSQLLAAGCSDGSIVLFSTSDDGLRFDRVLTKRMSKNSRCISLTWRDRNTIVAGFEESLIRVFDIRSKSVIRQMTIGKSREGSQILVWAVKCLPNGTILSGDSSGELKVWDSENFSLVQRLRTHNADVLDITTNYAGTMILTCGVDRRTVAYAPIANQPSQKTQRWYEIRHRRFHEHDVKALTSFESKSLSVAVSGGIDTVPVVIPMKNWDEEYHRSLSHLEQNPRMSISTKARLMLTWWGRDLLIWQLPHRYNEPADIDSIPDDQMNHQLLAQIQLKDDEHISSAELSSSGDMVIAATSMGVKLFQIRRVLSNAGLDEVRSRPIELPKPLASQGASKVGFSTDGKWIFAVRLNNVVLLAKVNRAASHKDRPTVYDRIVKLDRKKRLDQTSSPSMLGQYFKHVSATAFSSDGRIFAVGDLSGAIDTWILEGHEDNDTNALQPVINGDVSSDDGSDSESDSDDETDSRVIQGQKWIRTPAGSQLPTLENAILALAFKPSSVRAISPGHIQGNEGLHPTRHNHHPISPEHPSVESGYLTAVTSANHIIEFDTINCKLSDWSRRNPAGLLPEKFRQIKDRVMGMWFDVRPSLDISRLWLYGSNFIYMLDLTRDLSTTDEQSRSKDLIAIGRLGQHSIQVEPDHALAQNLPENISHNKKRKRRTDGAGDAMRPREKYSTKVRRMTSDEALQGSLPSPPGSQVQDDNDADDVDEMDVDEDDVEQSLAIRRRNPAREVGDLIGQNEGEEEDENEDEDGENNEDNDRPASWCTFQYRGIFGICALQKEISDRSAENPGREKDDESESAPEIVIVERPLYDIELVPRFSDGQDW